jgi:hypothetical protein
MYNYKRGLDRLAYTIRRWIGMLSKTVATQPKKLEALEQEEPMTQPFLD